MIVYYNNSFLPLEELRISPFDRGYLFADGVYEAIRTYNRKLFCYEEHLSRLRYSLNELKIPFDNFSDLKIICGQLAEKNNLRNEFGIYLQITRGISFPRKHSFDENLKPNLFIYAYELKDHDKELSEGVSVILEKDIRWERCDIKSISLLPSVLANTNAINKKNYEAVFYRNELITEGSHTNFFAVKNDVLFTAPLCNLILEGVTRNLVLKICKENKISIREEFINIKDLKNFDEFFITGTTTEITPVVKLDNRIVGDGNPGKLTQILQKKFFELTKSF